MRTIHFLGLFALALATASCSTSKDEPSPSPVPETNVLSLKLVYDYNMLWTDALLQNPTSANVWAFGGDGELVWSGAASAVDFEKEGFRMNAELPEGEYELVAWCGLDGNDAVKLNTYKPKSKEELYLAIQTRDVNGLHVSDEYLSGIFYAYASGVKVNGGDVSGNAATMSLIKDTKDFKVALHSIDGSTVDMGDFSVSITDDNGMYAWDNSIVQSSAITYRPWTADNGGVRLSTGRLTVASSPRLSVTCKADNREIISIPLLNYLLLLKEHYGHSIANQEFLDREDSYSFVFMLDGNNNWLSDAGIVINDWTFRPATDFDLY